MNVNADQIEQKGLSDFFPSHGLSCCHNPTLGLIWMHVYPSLQHMWIEMDTCASKRGLNWSTKEKCYVFYRKCEITLVCMYVSVCVSITMFF
jgi:hypothetical protein